MNTSAFPIAVLVSGNGSNLQAIIDAIAHQTIEASISCVIADRACFALERARQHHLPHYQVKRGETLSESIQDLLAHHPSELVVMAGFLSILPPDFCRHWQDKIINIHPSLLPKHGGIGMWGHHVHRAVLEQKDAESGATVHYVSAEVDKGAILAQASCPVSPEDNVETLASKVHALEHPLLIKAIHLIIKRSKEKTKEK